MASSVTQTILSPIANGTKAIFQQVMSNIQNAGTIGAFWEVAIFIGSADVANQLYPYHVSSTVDLSNWQILGACPVVVPSVSATNGVIQTTTGYTDITQLIQSITIRNISAGTVDLIQQARPRYIFNRG